VSKNSKKTKRNRNRNQSTNTLNDSQANSSHDEEPKLNMMDPELCTGLARKFALVNRSSGVSRDSEYSGPSDHTKNSGLSASTPKKSTTTSDAESLISHLKPSTHEKSNIIMNV